MCIALLKEHGVALPEKEVLQLCWDLNSDGAGYAYLTQDDTWAVRKGLMTFQAFWESYSSHNFKPEHTLIIHFRVGTAGKMNPDGTCFDGCTHPFPITEDKKELMSLKYVSENIMMHNGVVGKGDGYLSDSQMFVADYGVTLLPYIDDPKIVSLLTECLDAGYKGSRWFLATGANYHLMGNWICDKDTKIWYSNDGYIPVVKPKFDKTHWDALMTKYTRSRNEVKAPLAITELVDRNAYEFMSGSAWNWIKWDALMSNESTTTQKPETKTVPWDEDDIFNTDNKIIGFVDRDGDVIWDDMTETVSDDVPTYDNLETELVDIIECNDCGAELHLSHINDGLCPYCYSDLTVEIIKTKSNSCPRCEEPEHINVSDFDVGDYECMRCGAIFVELPDGNKVVGENYDTAAMHAEAVKVMLG